MAKQNFVSGGFYGKLGQLVGQRWKNKRTVRAYVVPHNPRTEKQQANRHTFGALTANAQLGQQMNFKAPCFISDEKTEWGLRMTQASILLKAGQQNMNLIPLFPNGYTPLYQITEYMLMARPSDTSVRIRVKGTLPADARKISILVAFYDSALTGYDFELYNAVTIPGENTEFLIENTVAQKFDATTRVLLVSNDDAEHSNAMLYGAENALKIYAKTRRKFNFGNPTLTTSSISYDEATARYSLTATIVFAEPYAESEQEIKNFSLRCVRGGLFQSVDYDSVAFTNQNGFFGISLTSSSVNPSQIFAFPNGSQISIEKLQIETDTEILTGESEAVAISNDDLNRSYSPQVTSAAQSGNVITFTLAKPLPSAVGITGGVSLYSVKAGRFVTESADVTDIGGSELKITVGALSGINQNALPAGSKVTIGVKLSSNGVVYSPTADTAQSVSTSDLVRSFSIDDGVKTESATGFEINFPLYVDGFAFSKITLDQYSTLKPFSENIKAGVYEANADKNESSNLRWKASGHYGDYIDNAVFTPPVSYKANGVTYNVKANSYYSQKTDGTQFVVTFTGSDFSGGSTVKKSFASLDSTFKEVTGFTEETFVAPFEVEDYEIRSPQIFMSGMTEDGEEFQGEKPSLIQLSFFRNMDGDLEAGVNYAEYKGSPVEQIYLIAGSADMLQPGELVLPLQASSSNKYARGLTLRFA